MLVVRLYDDALAQACYLIGCQQTGEAIVIDPPRDIAPVLAAARKENVKIGLVTETHIHADFLSGTRELAQATGARIALSGAGDADWQYRFPAPDGVTLLHDGDVLMLGRVRITVMHTPGHTPEHLAFIVTDTARSEDPVAMVSGDFIFVGDVGRPDLLEAAAGVAGSKDSSARALYHSLQRLAPLPDYLQVWPGHGAGSACGKALGSLPSSTLGYERRTNWALQPMSEAEFVAAVLDGQPAPPTYFAVMKRMNRAGAPVLGTRPAIAMLPAQQLEPAQRDGIVIDVRPRRVWAERHLKGSLNLPPIQAFTKWAGWLVPHDRDVYLIADDAAGADKARRALAAIGLDRVIGAFTPDVITDSNHATEQRGKIASAGAMHAEGRQVIDLRDDHEWAAGHLEFAQHHPLGRVREALAGLDRGTPVAVHCEGGTRSAIGASLLEQLGFTDVIDLADGWGAHK